MQILQFKKTKTSFQKELLAKKNDIKKTKLVLIMADKTKEIILNAPRQIQEEIIQDGYCQ